MSSTGTQKVLRKLETSLQAGQFYEAHEMFKTVYYRHRARGQSEESYGLCQEGARLQLQQGQLNCGVELCMLLLEAYEGDSLQPGDEAVQRVMRLIEAFPTHARPPAEEPPVAECSKFAAAAVKWLRRSGGDSWRYEPQVEGALAAYITASLGWQGLGLALPHYARCGDASAMAAAVSEAARHGDVGEEDLFVARAALCMASERLPPSAAADAGSQQVSGAQRLVTDAYAAAAGHAAPDTPLLHFVSFFLRALELRSAELVQLLLQWYSSSLDRDPTLWQLVLKARDVHIGPVHGGMGGDAGGLLGDLFSAVFAQPVR